MLINRNKMPKVTIFKHKDVMDSYVSRNETNGIIPAITSKIDNYIQMIHNNFGFEYCEVPREAITEIEKNVFKRDPLVDNIIGLNKRNDNSMSNENVLSFDRNNNIIGMITSDNIDSSYESTKFTGVHDLLYGKISYNERQINSIITDFSFNYNPYCECTLTDIVKSFLINGNIYSIHRGGYITIYTIETKVSKVISFIEEFSLYENIPIKNDTYFSKFELSNVVTNVATNNSLIIITTTTNSILFNIVTETYNILPLTVNGETIIEIQFYNSIIYYITNTGDKNYKIFRYNIITSEKNEITIINNNSNFFPNTITKLGNEIIAYECVSKFGKHLSTDIQYIHILNETDLTSIIKVELEFPVWISSITGTLTEMRVGLTSDDKLLDGSMIIIGSDNIKLLNKNINVFDKYIKVIFNDQSTIVAFSNKNVYFIYINSSNSQITCINVFDLCKNRNSGTYIVDCSVNEDEHCIITFDDNTQRIIVIDEVDYSNLYTTRKNNLFSIINNNIQTFFKNNELYTIVDNDINSLTITPHTEIFTEEEFNSISLFYSYNINETDSIFITMTNTDSFTRVTAFSLTYNNGIPTLTVLNNSGVGSILSTDINLIRKINNKILIPIKSNTLTSTFLIVYDFDKNIFIRNVLLSDYTKTFYIDELNNNCSIGINALVYRVSLSSIESILITDSDISIVQNIVSDLFINNSIETKSTDDVLQDYAVIDSSGFNISLLTLNNNVIFENSSKMIKLGNDYVFISKRDIKLYNYEFQLKTIYKNNLETDIIISLHKLTNYSYILFTKNGNIVVDTLNVNNLELSSIIYENKSTECVKNSGLITLCDDVVVSVIDTVNETYFYDIINRNIIDDYTSKQFNNQIHYFKVDSIERVNSSIFVSISYFNKENNCYLGSFVININGFNIKYIELTNITAIQTNTGKIDCNYTDMVLKDDFLYILYYNTNKIDCKIIDIDSFEEINMNNIYIIPSNVFFSGMIAEEDNLHILITDSNVIVTSYDEKTYVEPILPTITNFHKVIIKNKETFCFIKVDYTNLNISCHEKSLNNTTIFYIEFNNSVDNNLLFEFIQNNWKNIRLSIGETEFFIYNDSTKECVMIDYNKTKSFINGYKMYNIVRNENIYSNTFFNFFANGFIGFNNFSGLHREIYNKQFITLGDFIISKDSTYIDYNLNKYSCIKNNSFTTMVNFDKYSDDFMSVRVLSKLLNITKQINYCFFNDNIVFTDSKHLNKDEDNIIILLNNFPIINESYHYKLMENNCKVILNKDDDNLFGYKQCIFINSLNTIQTIDINSGLEIKPIYVDINENLYSIIKNDSGTYFLNGFDISNSTIIPEFNNVIDAIKIQDIDNSILLINQEGKVIVFNVNTLQYKTITFVDQCISGISDEYSFEKIISFSDYYTCTILVKNKQTNNYHIIPDCNILLELDSFQNPVFEVIVSSIGVIKSHFANQTLLSSFNIPIVNLTTGFNFNDCIKTLDNVNYNINITVSIGDISIDDDLNSNINNFSHTYTTQNKIIKPKIFIRNDYFIIQYGKKIIICQLIDKYSPIFTPLYEITQNDYSKTKIITDVMISGRNVLFTFSDKTCRVINIIGKLNDEDEQVTFYDNGFNYYTQYKIISDNVTKTFITELGYVGYIAGNLAYIYKDDENRFINVKTTSIIKFFCVDTLYGKIYCIDDLNNFGYIDILTYKYIPIKALTEITIINIVYTAYFTVEILTNKGIYIYMNENLYKLTNREPDGKDLIIYPYKQYSE